jgi:hypothetical protein
VQVQLLWHVHVAPAAHCSVQLPLVHEAEQEEPAAQVVAQSPLVQVTSHVAPAGHVVLQSPLSHVTTQLPPPHVSLQSPFEQSSVHAPTEGHAMSQLAPLQAQLPLGQEQLPAEHATGVPEEPTLEDDPPHARTKRTRANEEQGEKRISKPYPLRPELPKCVAQRRRLRGSAPSGT